jgi:hypothetical protein
VVNGGCHVAAASGYGIAGRSLSYDLSLRQINIRNKEFGVRLVDDSEFILATGTQAPSRRNCSTT